MEANTNDGVTPMTIEENPQQPPTTSTSSSSSTSSSMPHSLPLPPPPPANANATSSNMLPSTQPTRPALTPAQSLLYSLIIRQLKDDGFDAISSHLGVATNLPLDLSFPPRQLSNLVGSALAQLVVEEESNRDSMELGRPEDAIQDHDHQQNAEDTEETDANKEATMDDGKEALSIRDIYSHGGAPSNLLDLTLSSRISKLSTPFPPYSSRFGFSHNSGVTVAAFSSDGALAATGSRDTSIKLLDVARMRAAPAVDLNARIQKKKIVGTQPVVRTYYDHESAISDLAFHPFEPFLLSGSRDQTLKFFHYAPALQNQDDPTAGGAITRKCSKVLALENAPITSLSFHPSGDFVLVSTDQNFVRLYDVQSFSAYTSPDFTNFHSGGITAVRYHPIRGSSYATSSMDGTIKLWDGVSNLLIRTLTSAHSGAPVSSVEYSPSGKYLLTSGQDSTAKLWDVSNGKCLMTYHGVKHQSTHVRAAFEHSGEFVLCGDESSTGLAVWDTRTSEMVRRLDFHARAIRTVGVSPTDAAFITGGEDNRCRFWSV